MGEGGGHLPGIIFGNIRAGLGSIRFVSEQSCSTIFLFLSQPSSFLHSVLCLLRALLFPFFPGGVFICSLFFMLLPHFCFGVPLAPLNASRVPLSVYGAQPPFPTASRTFSPQSVGGGGEAETIPPSQLSGRSLPFQPFELSRTRVVFIRLVR